MEPIRPAWDLDMVGNNATARVCRNSLSDEQSAEGVRPLLLGILRCRGHSSLKPVGSSKMPFAFRLFPIRWAVSGRAGAHVHGWQALRTDR